MLWSCSILCRTLVLQETLCSVLRRTHTSWGIHTHADSIGYEVGVLDALSHATSHTSLDSDSMIKISKAVLPLG